VGTIVVGVDGSEESQNALRWAVEEAGLRGADLQVVHVYDYRPPLSAFAAAEGMSAEQIRQWQDNLRGEADAVRKDAEDLVGSVVRDVTDQSVEVHVVQDRHPAEALVEQSEGADMLVVGSRGRGGFTGLVLGSVSQQCLHHARCPVVVIPAGG
jgi:nucleotide-binding universal stress UspA family protein